MRRGTIPQDATLTSGSGDAGAVRLVGGAMGSGVGFETSFPPGNGSSEESCDWLAGGQSRRKRRRGGGGLHIAALVLRLTTRFHARRAGDGSRAETVAGGETATRQSTHTQPSD